jgi:hypothetical protein
MFMAVYAAAAANAIEHRHGSAGLNARVPEHFANARVQDSRSRLYGSA